MQFIAHSLHYILPFIVIISVIVFIHEFGHYLVAKWCGVRIEAFSLGFGPELFGWRDKSGTRWKVSALPLGGYVKMFGDMGAASTPDNSKLKEMSEDDRTKAFHYKRLEHKALIVMAGPISNFLLAIVILSFFFAYYGRPETKPEVGTVAANSAAAADGILPGDVIIKLRGENITRFEDIRTIASMHPGEALDITLNRKGETITKTITPKLSETTDIFGNKVRVGILGITSSGMNYRKMGVVESIGASFKEVYSISASTLSAIGQMLTGRRSADELSGILRIGEYSGQAAEQGWSVTLWFMAILSINLGLVNLFPIPVLDGGHLMYYAIEALKGKPLAQRFQDWGYRVGFALLIMLMAFATFNDLKHFNIF